MKSDRSFVSSSRSLVGLVRSGNEDSALVHSHLLAVADGMGGHAGGEIASALAIKTLSHLIPILDSLGADQESIEDLLLNSLHDINQEIANKVEGDPDLTGMGTTLSALMFSQDDDDRVALLHVGDSRCYRLRNNELIQLSHDHTVIQELLDQGAITTEEALEHPKRSFLTQALMGESSLAPVLMVYSTETNDRFLLCSDGLSGVLSEGELKQALLTLDREDCVARLVDAAYAHGAPDNVTLIVADFVEGSEFVETTFLGAAQ